MAQFLLLCLILAEVSIFMAATEATMSSNPAQLKAVEGAEMWMKSLMQPPVASPAPSEVRIASESPRIRQMGKHNHFNDNSVAGGDVIFGGFITAIVAAVVCYIRVSRKYLISPFRV